MAYFTNSQVLEAAAQAAGLSSAYLLNESKAAEVLSSSRRNIPGVAEANFGSPPSVLFDIFLSHASLDNRRTLGIYTILSRRGYVVYLDRIVDPHLTPATVNRGTARTLRYRLAQSRSVFVCTSNNTSASKWIPWEMGFGDGWKDGKVAILPIIDDAIFTGVEFFSLYPEVRDDPGRAKPYDLDLYDAGKYLGYWGKWISDARTW